ncbi:hypothetical protein BC936DRAFT_137957 [Jimgerdemannia flammicorona]|uniref:Protein kinase domain-containing protein n=1 Tax=Jimgerdemannia flammicorona TaxID=994334 RepID=A0A433DIN0_9FUNG|nr:hypothetical protein BC936DRAFT_137957 [Jimgerdemannia flammicorona]
MSTLPLGDTDRLMAAKCLYETSSSHRWQDLRSTQDNKQNFPYDKELKRHLEALNVSVLADRLVWVPFSRLENVWKGTVRWRPHQYISGVYDHGYASNDFPRNTDAVEREFALKEIDSSMASEVVLAAHLSWNRDFFYPGPTMDLIGLSYHPIRNKYLMVMECADNNLEDHLLSTTTTSWRETIHLAGALAYQLSECHDFGVLHHDLHARNVVLGVLGSEPGQAAVR